MAEEKPKSKAEAVREFLHKEPKAKPRDVVQTLAENNVAVTESYVREVRAKSKRKKTIAKKGRVPRPNKSTGAGSRAGRPYPARTLEEALRIPEAIRVQNNGKPWDTEDVARAALDVAKSNNKFFYAAAAARDYGLTVGTRDTEKIELAPLGREIFFAENDESKHKHMLQAFFSIDLFKRVFEHYGSAELPKKEYLSNTLQKEFDLEPQFHEEFAKIFKANCRFLGIEKGLDPSEQLPEREETLPHLSDIRVVGQPKGKFDRTAFVIMPFAEKGENPRPEGFFPELLNSLITPAANAAGFAVETARQQGSDVIQSTIINQLLQAELVIVDLTDHNPNVLFELGIRIAKDLPVALIKADGTGRIFDVDNMMRVLGYDPNLWPSTVERDIPRLMDHIKGAWNNRTTVRTYMQILTGQIHTGTGAHQA